MSLIKTIMDIKQLRGKVYLFLVLNLILIVSGCVESQKALRAYIIDEQSNWRIIEKDGYEGGSPKVDFLVGKDMTIRLECDTDYKSKHFFNIRTSFTSINDNDVTYKPLSISVKLQTAEVLKPKVFTCSYTIWELNSLRSSPSLKNPVPVNVNSCYLLFFDHPIITVDEEIVVNMNDALSVKNEPVVVPAIVFKKNPKLQDKEEIKAYFR